MAATIITHGANTWRVTDSDSSAYIVSRTRGVGSDNEPRGWAWTVRGWRGSSSGPRGFQRQHWHRLPAHGPKAARVIAIVERMLAEVR